MFLHSTNFRVHALFSYLTVLLVFSCLTSTAQNIIQNPGFEEWNSVKLERSCQPYLIVRDTDVVRGWFSLGNASSPINECPSYKKHRKDYLKHSISPKSGTQMGEFCVNRIPAGTNSRVYICGSLLNPLVKDGIYNMTFYISPNNGCEYGVSELGIFFTAQASPDFLFNKDFSITPQIIIETTEITEKGKWKKIDITYKANGGEEYFIIGNFLNDSKTKSVQFSKNTSDNKEWEYHASSYYSIDDFSLTMMSIEAEENLVTNESIVLQNIFFETSKSTLLSNSFETLDSLFQFLNNHPELRIELSGHTDNTGNEEENILLSEARAKSIVDYLYTKGIASDRMNWKGYGSSKPLNGNENEIDRLQNRRVEFRAIR